MNIILHGATGAMGHAVDRYVKANGKHQIIAYVSPDYEETAPPCYKTLFEYEGPADCIVDFSSHFAAGAITEYAAKRGIPLVIATTGHTEDEAALIKACSAKVPVFQSANMSLGVAVLAKLAKTAASFFPDADIEIVAGARKTGASASRSRTARRAAWGSMAGSWNITTTARWTRPAARP